MIAAHHRGCNDVNTGLYKHNTATLSGVQYRNIGRDKLFIAARGPTLHRQACIGPESVLPARCRVYGMG